MRRKKETNSELFFTTFAGEYVKIITTVIISETIETEEGIATSESPLTVEGFLLDFDDTFFYLGAGPEQVSHAVNKETVSVVQTGVEVKDVGIYDEILESMPDPTDEKEIN